MRTWKKKTVSPAVIFVAEGCQKRITTSPLMVNIVATTASIAGVATVKLVQSLTIQTI
jgi:hypothetical protein